MSCYEMSYNLIWIFFLIIHAFAASLPIQKQFDSSVGDFGPEPLVSSRNVPKYEDSSDSSNEQVISVRITSSVAVGRGKPTQKPSPQGFQGFSRKPPSTIAQSTINPNTEDSIQTSTTDIPSNLIGANIEYIKQLNARKEPKEHSFESVHPFQLATKTQQSDEPLTEESTINDNDYEYEVNVPLARKIPSASDANQVNDQEQHRVIPNSDESMDFKTEENAKNSIDLIKGTSNKPRPKLNPINENIDDATAHPAMEQRTERRDINKLTDDGTHLLNHDYQPADSIAESSIKSIEFSKTNKYVGNIPLPGTGQVQNFVHSFTNTPINEGRGSSRLTTVSFNIVHDEPKVVPNNNKPSDGYATQSQTVESQQYYEPPKIYSQPAQIYSEPAKFYSEPAKVYSEPAKIYSEPAKVYSEPAKIYSEPAKFYSEPASLHLNENIPSVPPNYSPWQHTRITGTTINTTPLTTVARPTHLTSTQTDHLPEKNYEVDEKVSVMTRGRSHGVQETRETTTEKCKDDDCKVGYVVEGRQFKKYRVEERTSDGFIVGEYGVVRNEDGALRGVRYTADSDASPRLIQDALMKFLQLK